jgi:Uma2 family endonuclease
MIAQPNLMTVDEFEQVIARPENRDRLFELIHGVIVEKVPTREHGIIAGNTVTELNLYLDANDIGTAAVEARHRPPDDPHNDRLPDVSVVLGHKPVARRGPENFIPDLCVEIQSPDETPRSMSEKAAFYLAHGARMVWLVYPQQRIVEVLTATDRQLLTGQDVLDGGEVLPGFSVPVHHLFRRL